MLKQKVRRKVVQLLAEEDDGDAQDGDRDAGGDLLGLHSSMVPLALPPPLPPPLREPDPAALPSAAAILAAVLPPLPEPPLPEEWMEKPAAAVNLELTRFRGHIQSRGSKEGSTMARNQRRYPPESRREIVGLMSGSVITSPESTRASWPTSMPRSASSGCMRWRRRTRRC